MIILAHRGYWLEPAEKNSRTAFERSFDAGFGVETDLRDCAGEIVIAHDMPRGAEMTFTELLKLMAGRNLPLALNIKADGLGPAVMELLDRYGHDNYFTFDMSVPDMAAQLKVGLNVFTGLSDLAPAPVLLPACQGVWLDCFDADWYGPGLIDGLLCAGKKVGLVSAELHQRAFETQWSIIRQCKGLANPALMLCTDNPAQALEYFND